MVHSYDEDLKIGDRIAGRYEILAVIGQGSMGVVYKCRHDILGRVVAIKTLRLRERTTDDRAQKRFEREARATSRLDHPNLIGVHDFGYTTSGDPYLVMDFVSGQPLFDIMKRERYLIAERAVHLFSQVCDGLFHAHQRGVIHRDLKPANILVVRNENAPETVRIVDLGVAKIVQGEEEGEAITMTGEVCGSPIYLSPEQCMYQELDPRTDIYSLGVCIYEALMGQPPLRGASVYDTIYMHVHEMPRPFSAIPGGNPDVPKKLEEVVFRCLAKQPNDRYETMLQLKQDLLASLSSQRETSSIKVLPPESLFGNGHKPAGANGQAARKISGELPKPGAPVDPVMPERIAAEPPAPPELQPPVPPRMPREPKPTHAKLLVQPPSEKPAKPPVHSPAERAGSSARTPRARGHERRPEAGAKSGKKENKESLLEQLGLRKIIIFASCGSVAFGLAIGFGFAYFLGINNPHGTQTTASAVPTTFEPHITIPPVEPPVTKPAGDSSTPNIDADPSAKSKAAKGKNPGGAGKKGTNRAETLTDLNRLLDDSPASSQGSQSKYFSIVKNAGGHAVRGGRPMPGGRPLLSSGGRPYMNPGGSLISSLPSGSAPLNNSTQALQKFKDNPFIEKMKQFAASQGLPLPNQSAAPQEQPTASPFFNGGQGMPTPFKQPAQQPSAGQLWRQGGSLLQPLEGGASGGNANQVAELSHEATQLCQSKQYGAACQKFETIMRVDPGNQEVRPLYAWALNAYALDLNKQQHYGEAVEYCKKACNMAPDKEIYHKNLNRFSQNLEAQKSGSL